MPLGAQVKKQLLLGVALGALAVSPSLAQPPALPPAVAAAVFNWTGFYAGVNAGYSWGQGDFTYQEPGFGTFGLPVVISGSQHIDGPVGGLQAGYNLQVAPNFVVGVETDFDWTGEKGSNSFSFNYGTPFEGATGTLSGTVKAKLDWLGTTRFRAGALVTPNLLAFVTAGFAYGHVSVSGSFTDTGCTPACSWSFSGGQVRTGVAAGAGLEGTIPSLPAWTWRVEYLYVDLGTVRGSGFDSDFGSSFNWSQSVIDNIIRAGVNLKLP